VKLLAITKKPDATRPVLLFSQENPHHPCSIHIHELEVSRFVLDVMKSMISWYVVVVIMEGTLQASVKYAKEHRIIKTLIKFNYINTFFITP